MNLADSKWKRFLYILVFSLSALTTPAGARAHPPDTAVLKGMIAAALGSQISVGAELFLSDFKKEQAPRSTQVSSSVKVWTNKIMYHRGEPIVVTIHNELPTIIYAPPVRRLFCSVVTVQTVEAKKWVTKDSCPPGGLPLDPPSVIHIPSNGKTSGSLGGYPIPRAGAQKTVDSVSVVALREISPVESSPETVQRSDLKPEIPEGGIRPPFSALDGVLQSGKHRIVFTFTVGAISGPTQSTYSREFSVVD